MADGKNNGGMSLFSTLTVIFVVLKLVGVIDWPWYLVFAPIWLPLAVVIGLGLIFATIAFFTEG